MNKIIYLLVVVAVFAQINAESSDPPSADSGAAAENSPPKDAPAKNTGAAPAIGGAPELPFVKIAKKVIDEIPQTMDKFMDGFGLGGNGKPATAA